MDKNILKDQEYEMLKRISENERLSQRQLSKELGISVSTVNVLMNKMIREGYVKMTQVSKRQVAYMLTPIGLFEKSKKTMAYLKRHYKVIDESKERIKGALLQLEAIYEDIFILIQDEDVKALVTMATEELKKRGQKINVIMLDHWEDAWINEDKKQVLIYGMGIKNVETIENIAVLNLMEVI